MSFMQRQVIEADYFEVETNQGTFIVPADEVTQSKTAIVDVELFEAFIPAGAEVQGDDDFLERKHGWIARLSAPGYLDCTDWSAFKTEQAANAWLDEFYGDDE